jgi:hypothetical protein
VVTLQEPFSIRTARLTREGRKQLGHIQALLRSHPHGPVRIEAHAPLRLAGMRGSLAKKRAAAVRRLLGSDRVQVDSSAAALVDDDSVDIVFSAYVLPPP